MRRAPWLVLALALSLVAASCGDDDDDTGDGGDTGTEETTTVAAADGGAAEETTTVAPADAGDATTTTAAPEGDASEVTTDPDTGRLIPAECAAGENTADESIGVATDSVNFATLGIDYGPLADIGFAPSGTNPGDFMTALIDDLNANGGVCGRTINYDGVLYDIIRREGGTGCIKVTEDVTNLAVFVQGGTPEATCVAAAGPVTYSQHDFSEVFVADVIDNMYINQPSFDDQVRATVQYAIDSGQLDGKVVGVWYGWVFTDLGDAVEQIALPLLDEAGIEHIDFRTDFLGPSDPQGNAVLLAAATEFASAPIDVMLNFTGTTNHTGIQLELAAQGVTPVYISAPVSGNASNALFNEAYGTAEIADGEQVVTFAYAPDELLPGVNPAVDSCNEQVAALTGEAMEPGAFDYSSVGNQCLQFDMLVAALSVAGPELTRESFAAAFESLPPRPSARGLGLESFGPDQHFVEGSWGVQVLDGATNTYTTGDRFELAE